LDGRLNASNGYKEERVKFQQLNVMTALAGSACLCVFFAASASASPINGQANIGGSVTVSATAINFAPAFIALGAGIPFQTGDFLGETGGTIKSLSSGIVGADSIVDFAIFTGGVTSPIHFDLTSVLAGVGTNAACLTNTLGAECTPTGSPFTLIQEAGAVSVSLVLDGVSYGGTSASGTSPTIGSFTTQVTVPGTVSGILNALSTGGSISASYSATFTATAPATTPEPGTSLLFGTGLIGLGLMVRRLRRN
jgi:hypothetical protein